MKLRVKLKLNKKKFLGLVVLISLGLVCYSTCQPELKNSNCFDSTKLPANIWINQVDVSQLTPNQAKNKLQSSLSLSNEVKILNASDSSLVQSELLGLDYDFKIIDELNQGYQQNNIIQKLITCIELKLKPKSISLYPSLDRTKTKDYLNKLESKLGIKSQPASISLLKSNQLGSLKFTQAHSGINLNQAETWTSFNPKTNPPTLTLVFQPQPKALTTEEINDLKLKAKKLVGQKIRLKSNQILDPGVKAELSLNDQDLVSFLDPYGDFKLELINQKVAQLAQIINHPAKDARFKYDTKTFLVSQFEPDKPGLKLDQDYLTAQIVFALNQMLTSKEAESPLINLKIDVTQAKIKLKDTNKLGINELISQGESLYYHSISSRVHNVGLASKKVNNLIVKPHAEFSFNQAIGDVSARTGYRSAYIIKNGRTEKGDGGGVCQVSTTLFRAILDAGLKVTRRVPHSYRVSYYELDHKPGIDATVFNGNTDLRFINDTPGYILIRSINLPKKHYLRYEIYGTDDGRQATIVDHKTWGWQPPAPAEYIDDPSLPKGVTKQIDWSASGIKAKFTNVIKDKNGKIIRRDTYVSSYKPWSAKYLVGTKE